MADEPTRIAFETDPGPDFWTKEVQISPGAGLPTPWPPFRPRRLVELAGVTVEARYDPAEIERTVTLTGPISITVPDESLSPECRYAFGFLAGATGQPRDWLRGEDWLRGYLRGKLHRRKPRGR